MSDVTPDVTPDVVEAPDVAEAPAPAPAEGGELDIASLPPQAQEYIRELREEAKANRKANEPFKNAFGHFNESEQQYLLSMVDQLGSDQPAGAQAMYELSQRLLGIEQEAAEVEADPEVQKEAAEAGLTPEQVKEMVRREMEQEQMIASVEAETREVGFEPGTPEAAKLWDMAIALDEPDLAKVAPLVRQALGIEEPAAPESLINPPEEEEEETQYPSSPTATGGSGGTNAEAPSPPPPIQSDAMRERVRRRIMAEAGQ